MSTSYQARVRRLYETGQFCRSVTNAMMNPYNQKKSIKKSSRDTVTDADETKHRSVYWFRNALRLHDNPSLSDACDKSSHLLPVFIIDPSAPFAQSHDLGAGAIRANFILESIRELKLEKNIDIMVAVGDPKQVLPTILRATKSSHLYYEQDPAAPVRAQDAAILQHVRQQEATTSVTIRAHSTHTLHPLESYVQRCKDHVAPSQFEGFRKIFVKMKLRDEVPPLTPDAFPPLPWDKNDSKMLQELKEHMTLLTDEELADPVSVMEKHLGYTDVKAALAHRHKAGLNFCGGEKAALKLLEQQMARADWVGKFEKPNTLPNALKVDTTGLSPYVKHGCLSALRFYNELTKVYTTKYKQKLPEPLQVTLHGQLLWREFNTLTGYTTPNFEHMLNNPVARQIPWDNDPELLAAWRNSRTGYPFIDAIMTQLRETGWIHHLARHAVACFLTRGDLWQSWEQGAAVFEELLIDADWSINNFNWQWLSCTAHFYQYFRCYSPVAFGKKTDPEGNYIRKWLPQFKRFPAKFIYEPWKAPLATQQNCGVIVGENYPHPIVEHTVISKSNMSRMKEAYAAQADGRDMPEVPRMRNQVTLTSDEDAGNARKRHKASRYVDETH
ncbi:DNA photolyase [Mayamaea pseudoterrestris]|nr:DNA photolyase [Mayamaea pseudoterrestris]